MRHQSLIALASLALALLAPACADDTTSSGTDAFDAIVDPDTAAADTNLPGDGVVIIDTLTDTAGPADTSPGPDVVGGFGAPCQGNIDCLDSFCVEGEEGFFCTRPCDETCPVGMDCKSVLTGSADPVFLCLPRLAKRCVPCKSDFQCTGGACLEIDGSGQCATACQGPADCPTGYDCADDPAGVRPGSFCQPRSGSCSCTPELDGAQRTCVIANEAGTCYGVEICDPETGWEGCNARTPAEDLCDGLDNDCNGLVDDGVEDGGPCENTVAGVGTCHGVEVCLGPQGLVCTAPTPEAEVCDFKDNNCDGRVDEDFKDALGEWTTTANCGTCGNDCSTKISHGVGRCEAVGQGSPVCVVDRCDPDYVAINQFQCSLPPDVSCQPCATDGDCFGGSCVDLDGQRVCVSPCGGAAGSCAAGYACEAIAGGAERCLPLTGSCVCNATTDGQARACVRTNAAGTCFGQEVCSATTGWSGCNAREPAAEVCDGVDNDCNGVADDGVTPPTEPCENTVAGVGTCTGTWFCAAAAGGGVQWTCSAATPEPETCDFRDNNCDGQVDEGYKDQASGVYDADDACGSCGIGCDSAVPHASAGCVVSAGVARCEVIACEPGFYQAGPLTCLPVTEDLCTPCATDAQCPTPGDRCLTLDGGRFCGRDCSASNLHGAAAGACPTGYACEAVAGGPAQCVPASGSCSCLEGDGGEQRTCIRSNALGTCYGQETCEAGVGWTACSVADPAAEVCNGLDDDCNSAIDDVAGRGQACTITNAHGTCQGVRDCPASGPALVCVGKTPAAETCNYADDDCNGTADDPWAATLFTSCSAGKGVCQRFGFMACKADGSGVECNAQPGPAGTEICDGLDNDCDGLTDEGPWGDKGQPCTRGLGVCEVTGVLVCSADGATLTCSATPPTPGTSDPCDGLDNDCNGVVDDAFAADKGKVCSTGEGVCKAFGNLVCGAGGASLVCDATPGSGSPEVCDLVDNDCDGTVDNGFQVGGRYVNPTACGNCFTNCESIFDVAGGYGTCNTVPPLPMCALKCCRAGDTSHGCDGGDHFDLNGVPGDGCELLVDPGAIYVAATGAGALDDGTCGLAPTATGLGHPCRSIKKGIARAVALSRSKVLVASGQYVETVTVVDGVSLYGGYSAQTWQRAPDLFLTAITGNAASGHRVTVDATDITTKSTVIDGFTIYGQTATGVAENSYAVLVRRSNQRLTLTHNAIWAGSGGPGDSGTRGGDGTPGGGGSPGATAYEPRSGNAGYNCWAACNAAGISSAGGAGGTNGTCSNANGGKGGTADCPDFNESINQCATNTKISLQTQTTAGSNGQGASPGLGGKGGCDSLIDYEAVGDCSCLQPSFDATQCPNGVFSAAGRDGTKGGAGAAGARCNSAGGQLVSGHWQGTAGGAGGAGNSGSGGGGGGAGGGVESYYNGMCSAAYSDFGGTGGGGGAGGCGGGGGTAGKAGGGAFGVFVVFEANPGASVPAIRDNTIHTGYGGVGGRGGEAGTPGVGGNGGPGGAAAAANSSAWCANPGSKGGEGGDGGPGGGGGGGCGGASYGIWVGGPFTVSNLSGWTNAITLDGAGGSGGPGGQTTAGGNKGQDGLAGAHGLKNF